MLTYTYYCAANQRTIEVAHSMSATVSTCGALCKIAELDIGDTPPDSPLTPIISGGFLALSGRDKNSPPDPCCARPDSCLPQAMGHSCGSGCCCKS